ncbi:hypothetical protein [Actinacidiphila sp. ITFR-21]|nr:hypothetical protein [Streptomyces sp. ITFR-21]WNI17521.1 hypothetical protein RLT57_19705 [Streptomyces sp. ITFR-21]
MTVPTVPHPSRRPTVPPVRPLRRPTVLSVPLFGTVILPAPADAAA